MPQTISNDGELQIIAGAFSNYNHAAEAAGEFRKLGYFGSNTQVVTLDTDALRVESVVLGEVETSLFRNGVTKAQIDHYIGALKAGRTVVVVHNVRNPAPVIDIFDRFGAEYNPNGCRNLRQDVAGMTLGAVAGAASGGVIGGLLGGPIGMVAGIPAGAVLGGAAGGSIGKASEHKK